MTPRAVAEKAVLTENQSTQRLAELLTRIAKLPSTNPEPPQFFASFLQLSVAATGSTGGAVWLLQPGQSPQIFCHIDLEKASLQDNATQQQLVMESLAQVAEQEKVVILPGSNPAIDPQVQDGGPTNTSPYPFIFKPIRAGQKVAMALHLMARSESGDEQVRAVIGLLDQICESAETYLAHRRALVLEDDRKALAQLLKYSETVHESLDPQRVIAQMANTGRDAIGCERVVVWVDPAIKRSLIAVSGVDKPDKRAVLLQSVEKLARYCLRENKPIVGARDQLAQMDQEDELSPLLNAYFNASQLDRIFIQPVILEEKKLGAVAAEGFDEQTGANLAGVVSTVARHGALALHNALEMASVPLVRPFGKIQQVKADPNRRNKWLAILAVLLLGLLAAAFIPWTIQIDATCEIRPKVSRLVDSPLDGLQVAELLRTQGLVEQGEVICRLDDVTLKTEKAKVEAELAEVQAGQTERLNPTERRVSEMVVQQKLKRIELYEMQIEQATLRAPISGRILTPQNEMERLEGLTVDRGMPICEIADLSEWQLVMRVPQEEIGWVQRGLKEAEGGERPIKFFLAAYPKQRLFTRLSSVDQISQAPQLEDKGNAFMVRIDLTEQELSGLPAGLRPGSAGQAKIATCKRPLGYVLLRKAIRFFRVTFF